MKKILISLALFLFVAAVAAQTRMKYNFNAGWKVYVGDTAGGEKPGLNDESWKNITIPYAWNEDEAFKLSIEQLSTGIAWYRKHFKLPASAKGKKVFIEFEGIRQAGDFYLNGTHIGLHENGVTAFGFDLSNLVKFGDEENVIAVRIDNSWDYKEKATQTKYQWIDKNFNANYGGITRNVYLHITGQIYQTLPLFSSFGTTGVYVYADSINIPRRTVTINIQTQIKNEYDVPKTILLRAFLKGRNGGPTATLQGEPETIQPGETRICRLSGKFTGVHFWSWGFGYLYELQTMVFIDGKPVDVVITTTGFRKTAFKNGMIYLNDRVIQVHGYAQRTSNEWPAVGASVPAWMSDYSNGLMVEGNANLVRWMHITPAKQDIESCDRMGLMQAMPAGDAERDVQGIQWEQRKAVMRDAIIYNRNNPSIIFYECGNESISEQHMEEMIAIRNEYDPHGGRAIGSREMLNSRKAEYGGEMLYINKSAHIPMWAMEYSRDEGLRKYWDEFSPPFHKEGEGPLYRGQDASAYNHNQDAHAIENIRRWFDYWRERPGTGKRVSSGGVNIIFSETNTHHRGAENYRRSGEVDALRIIKENFYANKIMWDGWVDIERPGIHIIGHWNYAPGVTKNVYVISSADKVELSVNGKLIGTGEQQYRFLYVFRNIAWQPGVIKATGYDMSGKKITETKIETAGIPVALRLKAITSPAGFRADGHDMALVKVEVIDAKGNRCPTALNTIRFTLDGAAEWRGGMAQGPDNFILSKELPVECGVNRVLVRSTTTAGKITLTATADGLNGATLALNTVPVNVENGLVKTMPADGLPLNLKRGPTPATPSFRITRRAMQIVGAVSGSHTDSLFKSYDDNELTDWYNDGKLSTAWVEYELEKEATITQVVMKLNNFRTRLYPLRITVDGKEAFSGTTVSNLGYFTAICKPAKGKKVKIELLSGEKDTTTNLMTEVSGKKPDDGVTRDDSDAKGRLSIIEVEIYSSDK